MDAIAAHPIEMERLRAEATSVAESARYRRRRLADSARTVAEALKAAGLPVPPQLEQVVASAGTAPDASIPDMEHWVGAAISSLPTGRRTSASQDKDAQDLARRLAGDDPAATITAWAAARRLQPTEAERRLDKLAADLDTFDPEEAASFFKRIAAVATETSVGRRAMLTTPRSRPVSARGGSASHGRCNVCTADKRPRPLPHPRAKPLPRSRRVEAAVASRVPNGSNALVDEVKAFLDAEQKAAAAAARRRAVLGALLALGYEVRESMEKAWMQDGRIVVRKPAWLTTAWKSERQLMPSRLQVRLVGSDRPDQPRTAQRDRDQEVSWCGDFDRLKAHSLGMETRLSSSEQSSLAYSLYELLSFLLPTKMIRALRIFAPPTAFHLITSAQRFLPVEDHLAQAGVERSSRAGQRCWYETTGLTREINPVCSSFQDHQIDARSTASTPPRSNQC